MKLHENITIYSHQQYFGKIKQCEKCGLVGNKINSGISSFLLVQSWLCYRLTKDAIRDN